MPKKSLQPIVYRNTKNNYKTFLQQLNQYKAPLILQEEDSTVGLTQIVSGSIVTTNAVQTAQKKQLSFDQIFEVSFDIEKMYFDSDDEIALKRENKQIIIKQGQSSQIYGNILQQLKMEQEILEQVNNQKPILNQLTNKQHLLKKEQQTQNDINQPYIIYQMNATQQIIQKMQKNQQINVKLEQKLLINTQKMHEQSLKQQFIVVETQRVTYKVEFDVQYQQKIKQKQISCQEQYQTYNWKKQSSQQSKQKLNHKQIKKPSQQQRQRSCQKNKEIKQQQYHRKYIKNLPFKTQTFDKSFQSQQFGQQLALTPKIQKSLTSPSSTIQRLLFTPSLLSQYTIQSPLFIEITQLARLYTLPSSLVGCVRLVQEDSRDQYNVKVFQAFLEHWKQALNNVNRKTLTLAKMRTIIVRQAMNQLVDSIIPPTQQEQYHLRICGQYRIRYIQAKVPIPPPRLNNSYLQHIFSDPDIKSFFQNYVQTQLELSLKDQNNRKIDLFELQINKAILLAKKFNKKQIKQFFQGQKKPYTHIQIDLIMKQARKISTQYGYSLKRIGNGAGRSVKRQQILPQQQQISKKAKKQLKRQQKQLKKQQKQLKKQQKQLKHKLKIQQLQHQHELKQTNKIHKMTYEQQSCNIKQQQEQFSSFKTHYQNKYKNKENNKKIKQNTFIQQDSDSQFQVSNNQFNNIYFQDQE